MALHPLPLMPSTPSPASALILHLPFSSSQVFGEEKTKILTPLKSFIYENKLILCK